MLEVRLPKPVTFDHAMTMEWLTEGQRVQEYRIEVWQGGTWKPVISSFAIGHKKIDRFPAVTSDRIRLHIVASAGEARIREFGVYRLGGTR